MANVLDLRRRIRSVKNTRQITKAMKMVSAAKLRRAQDRALAARPYSKMITSVLQSLTHRIDIYDSETGELVHPLFAVREEKRVLLLVVSGDKGFAGAFNANILKSALQFIEAAGPEKQIDIETVGRKGRDLLRRRYPAAQFTEATEQQTAVRQDRKGRIELMPDHPGMLLKLEIPDVVAIARSIVSRYVHEEIDAAYIVFNEFKSVIAQRVVIERILPIIEIGEQTVTSAAEPTEAERERAAEAALTSGISLDAADTHE